MTSTRRYRKALGFDICYQEIEKNLGKMYDPVIGRFVLDNWDKVITVLQKDEKLTGSSNSMTYSLSRFVS